MTATRLLILILLSKRCESLLSLVHGASNWAACRTHQIWILLHFSWGVSCSFPLLFLWSASQRSHHCIRDHSCILCFRGGEWVWFSGILKAFVICWSNISVVQPLAINDLLIIRFYSLFFWLNVCVKFPSLPLFMFFVSKIIVIYLPGTYVPCAQFR